MRISLIQPKIIRGDIDHNRVVIQKLVDSSKGDLLVLGEYAFTGSLVLDENADVHAWAEECAKAVSQMVIPKGKNLMANVLVESDGKLYNACRLLPTSDCTFKLFPDQTELNSGIVPGAEHKVFELFGKRFKVLICYDLPHISEIPTDHLDFLLFIYHFTENNFARVIDEVKAVSQARNLRVLASSLISDMNNGFSSYIDGQDVVSLSNTEGILEVEII